MAVNRTVQQIEGGQATPTTLQQAKAQLADLKAQLAALQATTVTTPTVYAQGGRIDSAGNYNAYNPEMAAAGMTSSGQTPDDAYYTNKVGTTGKTQAQLDAEAEEAKAKIAEEAAKAATAKAIADKNAAVTEAGLTPAQKAAALKAKQEAEAKAALEAAAKASAEALAKLQAELKAAQEKAEKDRIAAEKAIAEAKTAKELADAKAAKIKAEAEAARIAAEAKAALDKAAADAKTAKELADKALADAIAAGNAAAIAAAQKAAADAKAASDAQAAAAATAAAEAAAKLAAASLNVSGNVVTAAKIAADAAAKIEADRIAADAQLKESNRQSIITILQDRFAKYGLTGLGNKIKQLAVDGATEATITLGLMETDEYKTRFKANQTRLDKGLTVLQPAEYLNLEDGYRQVLRSYGLTAFDNDEYVQQFISNDVSAAELSNRVVTAVQRVQNADPAVIKQLGEFYGITSDRLVAYVLDPQQQFQKIERQVAAGEIGVAAGRQGLKVGSVVAEQLAAQGISMAEAQKGYATIADILPTAEKLSEIYGSTTQKYGQNEAEQEVFNSLASAQRKRQRLSATEVGTFGGSSGMNRVSLTSEKTAGQI